MSDWFYKLDGQEKGPVDAHTLKWLASAGTVRPDTPIRKATTGKWITAEHVKGLLPATADPTHGGLDASIPVAVPPALPTTGKIPTGMSGAAAEIEPNDAVGEPELVPAETVASTLPEATETEHESPTQSQTSQGNGGAGVAAAQARPPIPRHAQTGPLTPVPGTAPTTGATQVNVRCVFNIVAGAVTILCGLLCAAVLVDSSRKLNASGEELTTLRTVGGRTVDEAYFQEIGRYGQAGSDAIAGLGVGIAGTSIGLGVSLITRERLMIASP